MILMVALTQCQPSAVVSDSNPDKLTLDHRIFSDNPQNRAVAEKILETVHKVAQDQLCLTGRLNIAIFDQASQDQYQLGKAVREAAFPVQIMWPFEPLADDHAAISTSPIEFLTRPHSPNHILSHELGHLIFTAYMAQGQPKAGGYGSAAPDWLDEAAAILFDTPVKRELRRHTFKKTVREGAVLKLETLERLERVARDFRLDMPEPGGRKKDSQAEIIFLDRGRVATVQEDNLFLPDYYAQIDTLLLYLGERGESCPLTRFARGETLKDAIAESDYFAWLKDWAGSDAMTEGKPSGE